MLVAAITRTSTDLLVRARRDGGTCAPAARAAASPAWPASSRRSRRGTACRDRPARSSPARRSAAPVNAPFSWPKISLSSSVSGIAAQLMATNGNGRARTRADGSVCATSSLPVPDSPGDQHRRARRRRLLDHLIDLPHLRAVADHRTERAVLAQLTPQRLHLAQRLQPLDDLVEQDLQPLDVDRLGRGSRRRLPSSPRPRSRPCPARVSSSVDDVGALLLAARAAARARPCAASPDR